MSDSQWAFGDLTLLVVFVLGATGVLLVPGFPRQLEWAFGIPLLLVVPGYTVVAALFPADPSVARVEIGQPEPPRLAAKVGLALTTSALVVAVVGVVLSSVGLLRLRPVVLSLGGVSLVGAAIAGLRRQRLPLGERANPVTAATPRSVPDRLGLSGFQTFVFLLAALTLVGALGVAGSNPATESSFSEMSLLAGNDTDEVLGPEESVTLVQGEENTMTLRMTNNEGESVSYGIVGRLQRVGPDGAVSRSQCLGDQAVTVRDGETVDIEQRIDPSLTGDTLRLQYLVYTGPVPDNPRPETADLSVWHWVEAVEDEST